MKKFLPGLAVAASLVLVGCGGSSSSSDPQTTNNGTADARYRVTFNDVWTGANFPTNYPGNAHFSGLIGATHNNQVVFWEGGQPASAGVRNVAETGGKSPFDAEIQAQITAGTTQNLLSGPGIGATPGSAVVEFNISKDYPEVTLISMIAPSPDWFVGVHNLNLLGSDGEFVQSLTQNLEAYDAGTDNGATFTSGNSASPGEVITKLTCQPQDCDLLDGKHRDANAAQPYLGTFTFERLQ